MKTRSIIRFIFSTIVIFITSCNTSPTAKIQGVYEVDKDLLKKSLIEDMEGNSAFATGLLNMALENAVIEFKIEGDSIKGILFLAGETTLINSEIVERNDSLVVKREESEAFLIPTENGISFKLSGTNKVIELNKTERNEFSAKTKKAIDSQKLAVKEKQEFEENLGKWQKGNYVDEFGDKTGDGFAYTILRGSSENSITLKSEVFVNARVQNNELAFQIFNSALNMKESFPDSEFGTMKLKLPDGSVKSERVFFYENAVSESGENPILYNYLIENKGPVKVFIDLGTASDYYSDQYQFSIERNNLTDILEEL